MTREQVIRLVEPSVNAHQPDTYRLVVQDAWLSPVLGWVVAVQPDREEVDGLDWAKRLVDIQEDVQNRTEHEISVLPDLIRED